MAKRSKAVKVGIVISVTWVLFVTIFLLFIEAGLSVLTMRDWFDFPGFFTRFIIFNIPLVIAWIVWVLITTKPWRTKRD